MSREVREKVNLKTESYEAYKQTKTEKAYKEYAKRRNQAGWEVDKAQRNNEKEIARNIKTNTKAFFGHLNSKLKTKSGITELVGENGMVAESDEEKAEVLMDFFSSVMTNEDLENIPELTQRNPEELNEITVEKEDTEKQLAGLNTNKSTGPDDIHPRVLKELKKELAEPLTIIYNKSLKEGVLPEDWKSAQITPIYKKGCKTDPGNYRPVSLTSIACKILESIVRKPLINHFKSQLAPEQHGFVNGRSCATQLLDCLDKWTEMLEHKSAVDIIYLDFAKAFDSVAHQRLLVKLESYGIKEKVLKWIEAFLLGRRQRVRVNQAVSQWRPVTSGVPQGSVLGPVLFVIYINDMPEVVDSSIRLFADDAKLFSTANSSFERTQIQSDLDRLTEWSNKWLLRFNAKKCAVVHLGYKNERRKYEMKGEPENTVLAESDCEKDLGVFVDSKLKFDTHCQKAANKGNRLVGLVRRAFKHLDKDMMTQIIKGLIRPQLEYGNVAWSPLYKKEAVLLENVQRRATRLVPELKNMEYEDRLKAMNLPSLTYRRHRGDMIETYKYLNKMYNLEEIPLQQQHSQHETRSNGKSLTKEHAHLAVRRGFFSQRVPHAWNDLPREVVQAQSVNSFKSQLDRHLQHLRYNSTNFPLVPRIQRWQDRV
jgi:ribosomal protein L29